MSSPARVLNFPRSPLATPSGDVSLSLSQGNRFDTYNSFLRESDPYQSNIPAWLKEYKKANLPNVMRGLDKIRLAAEHEIPTVYGTLRLVLTDMFGIKYDYGLVSTRLVTTVGMGFVVDAFQNLVEPEVMKYHGFGTNSGAEAAGDTALGAECTTVLSPDSTRATGTTAEGASGNIYRTVGVITFDGTATITEHGIFTQSATGGGVLLDRSMFAGVGVVSGNSLQATYEITFVAGG